MQHLQSTIDRALEALDKLPPEFHRKLENPVELTGRKIQELLEFLRESGLDKIARNVKFLDDAEDVAHSLVSRNTDERNEAAKRITEITKLPSASKRPKDYLKRTQELATAASMSPVEYVEKILIPGGVLLATTEIFLLQKVRLGRKWITDTNGKLKPIRPALDLTVAEFIRWAFQKGHRYADEVVIDRPPLKDALTADRKAAAKKNKIRPCDEAKDPSEHWTAIPQRESHAAQRDRAGAIEFGAVQNAKDHYDDLRKKASAKDRSLLGLALKDGGNLLAVLADAGLKGAAIRQKKKQLKEKLAK